MQLKGVIFDLDGTLLDSMSMWHTLGADYLHQQGNIPKVQLQENVRSMSLPQVAAHFRIEYGLLQSEEEIIRQIIGLMEDKYRHSIPLKETAQAFLDKLKSENVKMCIATASDRKLVELALERLQIRDYFCGILTCQEAGAGKDKPDIYHQALELLGTDINETVVFEDALHAAETAKTAGFLVAGIYDKSAHEDKEALQVVADWYLTSFDEWELADKNVSKTVNHKY